MLKEVKMSKDWLVVKSNNLVNAKGKVAYTRNELKLIANLVAKIQPTDTNLETKKVALRELGFVLDNTKNHSQYDKYFEDLMSKPFKIPGSGFWVNWFSRLRYENGFIEYAFDEELKPFLLDLKANFTKYTLENILNLNSSYSIHIYELLTQFKDKGGRKILLKDFREILNIPNSYSNADVKRLITNVQKDLVKNTNIKFSFSFEKEGRSFNKINFKIMHNKIHREQNLFNYEQEQEKLDKLQGREEKPQNKPLKDSKEDTKKVSKSNVSLAATLNNLRIGNNDEN